MLSPSHPTTTTTTTTTTRTTTATLTPPRPPQLSITCSLVENYEWFTSDVKLYRVDGNPRVTFDIKDSRGSIYPAQEVLGEYNTVCQDQYYCGYRTAVAVVCSNNNCKLTVFGYRNELLLEREYYSLESFTISIYSKEETVSGISTITFYLLVEYGMLGVTLTYETRLWSWPITLTGNTVLPYPIEVYVKGDATVENCGRIAGYESAGKTGCPWAGAWHSIVSCALWDFFNFLWNLIYNLLPEPVKAFLSLINALLTGVSKVIIMALNPSYILLFTSLIVFVFLLYLVHEAIVNGAIGIINFLITVKEFAQSVVDFVLRLIQTLKP